jgi:triacylglycerol lipase
MINSIPRALLSPPSQAPYLILGLALALAAPLPAAPPDHVILLHGLARTSASMTPLALALRHSGYVVHNVDYPSCTAGIRELAEEFVGRAVNAAREAGATRIHFVTHSMGGILVRAYLVNHKLPELGRVVMLGPPNQGSEVVDRLRSWWVFRAMHGPAGSELGTDADSVPNRLGPVNYSVGVIAGRLSINWLNSLMIAGPNDGKVSIERTKVAGMSDHLVVATTHTFIMRNRTVIRQVRQFLANGKFTHEVDQHSAG